MPLFGPPKVKKLKAKGNVKGLIKALSYKKDQFVRRGAAIALGEIGDGRAVDPLIAALGDKDEDVRVAAAEALGEIGDKRAVEPLVAALEDERPWVRCKAAKALGQIGDARAVRPLVLVLGTWGNRYEKGWVRRIAAWALGQIGDEQAVESLRTTLGDEDKEVRRAAVSALERLGTLGTKAKPLNAAVHAAPMGGKITRCSKCGRQYKESLLIGGSSVKVAKCGACPVNRIFMVCERCADLEEIVRSPCPWCGARNLWQIQEMEQK